MARRPRQPTKGTTVKNRMGLPEQHHSVEYLREGSTAMLECGPAMSSSGNTRPRHVGPVVSSCGNTKLRELDANPNPRFLSSGPLRSLAENAGIHSNCARKMVKNRRCQPVGRPRWTFGSAMSPSGNTSSQIFGPAVSPCGNTRRREHGASPNPWFLASDPPHSLTQNS